MATARIGLPSFYTTGVAKILVGDQPCQFQVWLKGHYTITKMPPSGNLVKWKTDHTAQLHAEVDRLKSDGWTLTIERFFQLTGSTAILTGKPDLVKQKDGERPTVVDIKSGVPRESDIAQVCVYLIALPLAWKSPLMIFGGELVYPTQRITVTPAEADALKPALFQLLRRLGNGSLAPDPVPSEGNCRFCDVTKTDCPVRWDESTANVFVEAF